MNTVVALALTPWYLSTVALWGVTAAGLEVARRIAPPTTKRTPH